MAIDMRLISVKDGGRFAMSWVAGTNPKALRSNIQRSRVYSVDVSEVCESMMEEMKSKENRLSFRILFKLCFGTIHIFAEQVQHLYDVTLNFVCFNTFVLKQYSRKRLGFVAIHVLDMNTLIKSVNQLRSTITDKGNKRSRVESSDSLDITSLLLESEMFNDYSEKELKFPNDVGPSSEKKKMTSTCIQIKQITIRQISWDNPVPGEEEGFGEATEDDKMILLSELSDPDAVADLTSVPSSQNRKRKSSYEPTDCSPLKRSNGIVNESVDDIRCAPSVDNDTMSEFSIDCSDRSSKQVAKNIPDCNGNHMSQEELISTLPGDLPPVDDQMSQAVADLSEMNIPERIPIAFNEARSISNGIEPQKQQLKRRRSHLIIDKVTKLSKIGMEVCHGNVWQNCLYYLSKEHIAPIHQIRRQETFLAKTPSHRFQSKQLLVRLKNNLKPRMKQALHINRRLILQEILGDEYQVYKNDFGLKSFKESENKAKKLCGRYRVEEFQSFTKSIDKVPVPDVPIHNDCFQRNGYHESNGLTKDVLSLKCSMDEIDPYTLSFDFPAEAGKQRSEWGKEGTLMKLLLAWISKDPIINMNTIIVGASRIDAALAFHTLLDLAGLQYIEIVKDKHNSIASINMGPEMIRKINETLP